MGFLKSPPDSTIISFSLIFQLFRSLFILFRFLFGREFLVMATSFDFVLFLFLFSFLLCLILTVLSILSYLFVSFLISLFLFFCFLSDFSLSSFFLPLPVNQPLNRKDGSRR